jgi:hypothetical protein
MVNEQVGRRVEQAVLGCCHSPSLNEPELPNSILDCSSIFGVEDLCGV